MRGVEGTVWRGRGVLEGAGTQLPLAWTLDAAPLLQGELRAQIASFDGRSAVPRADDRRRPRQTIALRNVDAVAAGDLLVEALSEQHRCAASASRQAARSRSPARSSIGRRARSTARCAVVWRAARAHAAAVAAARLGRGHGDARRPTAASSPDPSPTRAAISTSAATSASAPTAAAPCRADAHAAPRATTRALARLLSTIGTPDGDGWRIAWRTPPR